MICAASAGGMRAIEYRFLATVALDEDVLGVPSIRYTELHLLDLIAPFGDLGYPHLYTLPFLRLWHIEKGNPCEQVEEGILGADA